MTKHTSIYHEGTEGNKDHLVVKAGRVTESVGAG
jgi:hypothetical protein